MPETPFNFSSPSELKHRFQPEIQKVHVKIKLLDTVESGGGGILKFVISSLFLFEEEFLTQKLPNERSKKVDSKQVLRLVILESSPFLVPCCNI